MERYRRWMPAVTAALALAGSAAAVSAQASPLVVEARAGAAVPLGDFANGDTVGEGTSGAPSFSVDFAVSGAGRRTLYLGFGQHRFLCENAGCPSGGRYVATTLEGGMRMNLRTTGLTIPWLSLGASTLRVESPGVLGSGAGVSRRGYGWDVGAGVYVGTSSPIAFNPGVRFRSATTELPGAATLRMRYLLIDLGVSLAF